MIYTLYHFNNPKGIFSKVFCVAERLKESLMYKGRREIQVSQHKEWLSNEYLETRFYIQSSSTEEGTTTKSCILSNRFFFLFTS